MKTYDIQDVEIFKIGKWNGHEITGTVLDSIVDSFKAIGGKIKPYLKLGHNEQQPLLDGLPSAGWVVDVRRKGESLFADFKAIPEKIYELINSKAYGRMSVEIYNNLIDGEAGKKYPKVLKAVALLGADTPAVTSLNDFINLYTEEHIAFDKIEIYNFEEVSTMEDARNFELEIEKLKTENTKLQADMKAMTDEFSQKLTEKEKAIETLEFSKREIEVTAYLDSAVKSGKITPAQIDHYKALCLAPVEVVKFSDKEMSQFELVKSLIDNAKPAVDFTESSQQAEIENPELNDDDGSALAMKAEKYAQEKGVSYKDALVAVSFGEDK